MKILHLMPFVPTSEHSACNSRSYHLLQMLSTRHDVTVVAFGFPDEHEKLRRQFDGALHGVHIVPYRWLNKYPRIGKSSPLMSLLSCRKRMQRTLDILLFDNDFDLIQAEFPIMGMFQFDSEAMTVLDYVRVPEPRFVRALHHLAAPLRKITQAGKESGLQGEDSWYSRFDALFVPTQREQRLFQRKLPALKTFVIPNGIDVSLYGQTPPAEDPHTMLFLGCPGYRATFNAALYFLDSIFPLVLKEIPDARVYLPAKRVPEKLWRKVSQNVLLFHKRDHDTSMLESKAAIHVAPVLHGANNIGAILEAMAMRKPVVATKAASEGLGAVNGKSILVENTPEELAGAIIELMRNGALRQRIGDGGYELAHSTYDWSVIADQMERAYVELITQRQKKGNNQPHMAEHQTEVMTKIENF